MLIASKAFLNLFFLVLVLKAQAQDNIQWVEPKSGDGILHLLTRYKIDPHEYKKDFITLNKGKFGKNQALLIGVKYKIDQGWITSNEEEWRVYPIFGPDHERLRIVDHSLQGAIFYLVAGHGGPDPGAVGKHPLGSLCEDEYAYDVTLRLARWLIERDALVYFVIRDNDDGIRDGRYLPCDKDEYAYTRGPIPRNQIARLRQRTNIVNELYKKHRGSKYQRMVAIHVDSRSTNENVDVFFYHHGNSKRGKRLATDMLNTFDKNYKEFQPNRTYRGSVKPRSGLYIMKNTNPAAVFIELGNIVNHRDQKRILVTENRQALAKWIGEGLVKNYKGK